MGLGGLSRLGWWMRNFLNIETIVVVSIFAVFIYFILTTKKQRFNLDGVDNVFREAAEQFHVDDTPVNIPVAASATKKPRPKKKHLHQDRCLEVMRDIFQCDFLTDYRPDWLKNPVTKCNLEIDIYNEDIETPLGRGIGLEYDGKQHSEYNPHFHRRGPEEFIYQCKKDSWKDVVTRSRGILLLRVPSFVAYEDLERYICTKLRREGMSRYVDDYESRKR